MKSLKFLKLIGCFVLAFAASMCAAQNPVPFVDSLSPDSMPPGETFTLTVHGAGFVNGSPGSAIYWNGIRLNSTTPVPGNPDELQAMVSAVNNPGTATVTVVNPGPGGGSSNPVPFTIIDPIPGLAFANTQTSPNTAPLGIATADFDGDHISDLALIVGLSSSCTYQFYGVREASRSFTEMATVHLTRFPLSVFPTCWEKRLAG